MDNSETQGYTHAVRWDDPHSYWRLSEGSGGTATNLVSGGPDASYRGSGVTYGELGILTESPSTCVRFTSGSAGLTTSESIGDAFAIEMLFKPTETSGDQQLCVGSNGLVIRRDSIGRLSFFINGMSGVVTGNTVMPNNVTAHIAVVKDQNGLNFIVNGKLDTVLTVPTVSSSNLNFFAGYAGWASDVAVYNYAPQLARFRKHYLDSISNHNVLESYPANIQPMVVVDAICNTLYGGGQDPSQLDLEFYTAWADRCLEDVPDGTGALIQRFEYNGIMDTRRTLWDSIGDIAHSGLATMSRNGLHYSGVQDAPSAPTKVYNVANVIKGSFKESWANADDRANTIDVIFYDQDNFFKRTILTITYEDVIASNKKLIPAKQVDLKGCTQIARAWHYGRFVLKSSQNLLRTVTFDSPIDSITSMPGDVCILQHDLPEWGDGGKLLSGCTVNTLYVDKDLAFNTATTFKILIRLRLALLMPSVSILNIRGSRVYISGGTLVDYAAATHFVFGDQERRIASASSTWIELDDVTGIVPGTTVGAIYAQNYLVQREVGAYGNRVITLISDLPVAPLEFDDYAYGSVTSDSGQPFHLMRVQRKYELDATLDFLEYQDSVYEDEVPQLSPAAVQTDPDAAVTNLQGAENYSPNGGNPTFSVSWLNGPATYGALVYVSVNYGPEILWADSRTGNSSTITGLYTGDALLVRVVGYDSNLRMAPYSTAPTITWNMLGTNAHPTNVTGFGVGVWNDTNQRLTLAWNANPESDISYYSLSYLTSLSVIPSQAQCDAAEIHRINVGTTSIDLNTGSYPGKGTYAIRAVNTKGYFSLTPARLVLSNYDDVQIGGGNGRPRNGSNSDPYPDPNPPFTITALNDGTGDAVFVPFTMKCASENISIVPSGYTIHGLVQGQAYYFYYDDPFWLGGNVTIHATQDASVLKDADSQGGRFIINRVPAVVPYYGFSLFRPTNNWYIGGNPPTDPTKAYDTISSTFMETRCSYETGNITTLPFSKPFSVGTVHARWYVNGARGVFDVDSSWSPAWEQDFNSLNFNTHPKEVLPGDPHDSGNLASPVVNNAQDTNGNYTGDIICGGAGYNAWQGGANRFKCILTGQFYVASAGTVNLMCYSQNGFIAGVDGGATASWGPNSFGGYTNTPLNNYPVLFGHNARDHRYDDYKDQVIYLTFPSPGVYNFEIGWAGGDDDITEFVLALAVGGFPYGTTIKPYS
jgi:hypothetical protein